MLLFEDILSTDEMFSDAFDYTTTDIVYEVNCQMITVKPGGDVDIGANPSAEGGDEALEDDVVKVNDVVHSFRLKQTSFGDLKSFRPYLKAYIQALQVKLFPADPNLPEGTKAPASPEQNAFQQRAKAYAGMVFANFADFDFYTGESMNPNGMVAVLNYRADGITLPSAREDRALREELVSHCQDILTRKHASVLFLLTLASSNQSQISTLFLPSLAPPPPTLRTTTTKPAEQAPLGPHLPRSRAKADLLREYRAKIGLSQLPERLLLRDALYLLQGISGKHIRFSFNDGSDTYNTLVFGDDAKHTISAPTKALIHRLSEVGYLYTRVEAYVRGTEAATVVGMIEQSLCHHLQSQLTEYYRLIAILESQMATTVTGQEDPEGTHDIGEISALTLRRLDVWINEWRLRMRMMSVCVESARDTHGGALVNLIHGYADNGDPFVRKFTDQLLEEVSKPFFATLHKWLFSGELYDPFSEFFVALDQSMAHIQNVHPSSLAGGIGQLSVDGGFGGDSDDVSSLRESGLRLWETKYQFQKEMLPMFVGEAFGRKIFSTGKSLNFIRYSCHDSDWVVTREKMSDTGGTGLERSIDTAYQIASQRLFEVFIEKFKLLDHLSALKNYLLLGHGDFADRLMEALGDPLDVRRRLDARMLEYSHGEIGWDVFTLEYKVDAPIDTVLDPTSMETYLKLFRHLWQMKRIEAALNVGWMRIAGGARNFLRVPELEYEWHKIRIVMAEMIHFVRQMQAYCQLEVIGCSWKVLIDFLNKKEGDLDALLDAHQSYLDRMAKKVLLLSSKTGKEETVLSQVKELFSTVLQYREAIDNFYNYCLTESSRRDEKLDAQRVGALLDIFLLY
ncbi:hypothetical protein C0991_003995 [Blastosporella zonata]|nr:hypothetical protein C0991_003995 [Blastosporella zonata]